MDNASRAMTRCAIWKPATATPAQKKRALSHRVPRKVSPSLTSWKLVSFADLFIFFSFLPPLLCAAQLCRTNTILSAADGKKRRKRNYFSPRDWHSRVGLPRPTGQRRPQKPQGCRQPQTGWNRQKNSSGAAKARISVSCYFSPTPSADLEHG